MSDSLRLVPLLIGQDAFEDLLIRLPDEFFGLLPEQKDWVWGELLGFVNQGVTEAGILATIADELIAGETVNVESIQIATKMIKEHGNEPVFEIGG